MKQYIQNLKSKPEAERKRAAYMATIACMVLVGGVWIYGLIYRFGDKELKAQTKDDVKPFQLLANSIKGTYQNVSASVNEAKSVSSFFKKDEPVVEEQMIDLIPIDKNIQ